jgi:hypothetical protein
VVLILAGVYSSYRKWIDKEIELAQTGFNAPKKIIAIEAWGSERTSIKVKKAANKMANQCNNWRNCSIRVKI